MEASVLKFWHDCANSPPAGPDRQIMPVDVFAFGDSRELANRLAVLVRDGVKTATCSALWTYEEEQKRCLKEEIILSFSMGTESR